MTTEIPFCSFSTIGVILKWVFSNAAKDLKKLSVRVMLNPGNVKSIKNVLRCSNKIKLKQINFFVVCVLDWSG